MLLKKITLKNFRQFKGVQSVEFATDPQKNVTVIMGENGSGKLLSHRHSLGACTG